MPVYESIKNAENRIVISEKSSNSVIFGWEKVIAVLFDMVKTGERNIAIDGWYGIDFERIAKALAEKVETSGQKAVLLPAYMLYRSRDEIMNLFN